MATQKESDIAMLVAGQCHLGTKNCTAAMERYTFKRRTDGIYVFDLGRTYEKLCLAARVIVAIENPQDVVAISARPYGQRGVLKFANYLGARATVGRHTPGAFTNQLQKGFEEPRLLVVTDPRTDHQAIKEAAYMNIPVIAFCDTDCDLSGIDIAIPANNKGKHSIGVLYYLLTRLVLQMRGTVSAVAPWDVMVDMFFYREPEEAREEAAAEAEPTAEYAAEGTLAAEEAAAPGFEAYNTGFAAEFATGFEPAAAAFEPAAAAAAPAPAATNIEYAAAQDFGAAF